MKDAEPGGADKLERHPAQVPFCNPSPVIDAETIRLRLTGGCPAGAEGQQNQERAESHGGGWQRWLGVSEGG